MIKPTIGRMVWFWKSGSSVLDSQPEAATVACVHSDRMVNLQVIGHDGHARSECSVVLRQPEDEVPHGPFCEWMPFQVGQAQKTEQAETQLEEARRLAAAGAPLIDPNAGAQTNAVVHPTKPSEPVDPVPPPKE